jgi:hypothetical protein
VCQNIRWRYILGTESGEEGGKTTGREPLKLTKMRDFSSKGSTNEAFLLVRAVQGCAKAVQSMEINYKVCNKSENV